MRQINIDFGASGLSRSSLESLGYDLFAIATKYTNYWYKPFTTTDYNVIINQERGTHCWFDITGMDNSMVKSDSFARDILTAYFRYGVNLDYDRQLSWIHD